MRLYLHAGLDLEAAVEFWSTLTGIPPAQFTKPYRAVADPTIRRNRHVTAARRRATAARLTHRRVMGMVAAVLSPTALPG